MLDTITAMINSCSMGNLVHMMTLMSYSFLGERNFHIFYQLLHGGGEQLLENLELEWESSQYFYLNQVYYQQFT